MQEKVHFMENNFVFNGPLGIIRSVADIQAAIEIKGLDWIMFPIALLRNNLARQDFVAIDYSFENSIQLVKAYTGLSGDIQNLLSGRLGFTRPIAGYRGEGERILRVDFAYDHGIIAHSRYCESVIRDKLGTILPDKRNRLRWVGFDYSHPAEPQ